MAQHVFDIEYSSKAIKCILSHANSTTAGNSKNLPEPSLIFTHGAGGTLQSDGIANFAAGFATRLPILCFQGNMNLKSRVKMFSAVTEDQASPANLGGRSMGARAAVMAATEQTRNLVLVSYPLHTGKEVRDQILQEIDSSIKVIFVTGDRDSMCGLDRLEEVRKQMSCKTWRVVIKGADHGMSVKPSKATEAIGKKIGEVVGDWIEFNDESRREGSIYCSEDEDAMWTGWSQEENSLGAVPELPAKRKASQNTNTQTSKRRKR